MQDNNRNWTILFVGGISGSGKSSFAYALGRHLGVKVIEVDDLMVAVKSVTTRETLPYCHYWSTGINWLEIGVQANVDWLINVSKEIYPILTAIVERHLEDNLPVIIEGDFIHPEFALSFHNPKIKALFLKEMDHQQLVHNYFEREGGEPQDFRAEVSIEYGKWQAERCKELGVKMIDVRPWDTAVDRAIKSLQED